MKTKFHKETLKINKGRPRGSITRFPGLIDAAARLGVTPSHLSRVLAGARSSQRLVAAILLLKGHPLLSALQSSNHPLTHV